MKNTNKEKNGILGIGVATMDIYVNRGRMYPGGNEYNVACNAKMLGARAGFLGVFGNDQYGPLLEDTLMRCGVEVSHCHHETGSSGYSLVEINADGDRVFLDWNKQGVTDLYPVRFTREELEYVKSFQVASAGRLSTVTPERLRLLNENGVDICYDFHAAYSEEEIRALSPYLQYGFFSCSHLTVPQIKATLKLAVDSGCALAVGTRGIETILAYDGQNWYEQETFPVLDVVDALGAGDSYIGAFLVSYLANSDCTQPRRIQTALEYAARHAATVVVKEGSIGIGYQSTQDNGR